MDYYILLFNHMELLFIIALSQFMKIFLLDFLTVSHKQEHMHLYSNQHPILLIHMDHHSNVFKRRGNTKQKHVNHHIFSKFYL
jgi:hypothetical protein